MTRITLYGRALYRVSRQLSVPLTCYTKAGACLQDASKLPVGSKYSRKLDLVAYNAVHVTQVMTVGLLKVHKLAFYRLLVFNQFAQAYT